MNKLTPIFIAGALAVSAGLAFAQSQMNTPETMPGHAGHSMSAPATDADGPSTQAYRAANDKMHAEMAIEFTGDADIDFMQGMIPTTRAPSTWPAWSSSMARTPRSASLPKR
jgi:uncharacterized protein (DUF305 family)